MPNDNVQEEFVRHYRRLIEQTRDDPAELGGSLQRDPEFATFLERLLQLYRDFNAHRKFERGRGIRARHPDFREAFRDFEERWLDAFDVLRDWKYKQEILQLSANFLGNYRLLLERTAGDPNAIGFARERDSELGRVIAELAVFLRGFNLTVKVKRANEVLHPSGAAPVREDFYSIGTRHRDPMHGIIVVWLRELREMIERASPTAQESSSGPSAK
jgi:hypothetical protein